MRPKNLGNSRVLAGIEDTSGIVGGRGQLSESRIKRRKRINADFLNPWHEEN